MKKIYVFAALALLGCVSNTETSNSELDASSVKDGTSLHDTFVVQDSNDSGMIDSTIYTDGGKVIDSTIDRVLFLTDSSVVYEYDSAVYDSAVCVDAKLDKLYITNDIKLVQTVSIPYVSTDASNSIDVKKVVEDTINNGTVTYDPYGFYFLLTSSDVPVSGFCYILCGYHESFQVTLPDGGKGLVRYSIVPDSAACPLGCNPFGMSTADSMASIMAHELSEGATDPDPLTVPNPAWQDYWGSEVGDKCAWNYGTTYNNSGSLYNIEFASRKWLIQQFWVLGGSNNTNHCALDLTGDPGFNADAAVVDPLDSGFPLYNFTEMKYLGGPVLTDHINIYYIYYGAWADTNLVQTKDVLAQFANGIGGSNWWQMVTKYYWEPGCHGDGGLSDSDGKTPDVGD